jgi:P27 family predicted phage terminase small subunit
LPQRTDEPAGSDGPALLLPFVASDERARWYFDRLIEDLRRMGLYAAEDYAAHNRWAALMAEMERADAEVRQTGLVIETAQGKWQNPMKKVRDDAWAEASKIGKEFGLTPASRVGLVSSRKSKGMPRASKRSSSRRSPDQLDPVAGFSASATARKGRLV